MHHKARLPEHLDSPTMPFFARISRRRSSLAALASLALASPLLAGCGEDRSNLIPPETADSLVRKLDKVQKLAGQGDCFAAQDLAASAQAEIEGMGGEIDPELKRSLLDGVTQLQVFAGDPEKCTQADTNPIDPTVTEEPAVDTGGTTGTTGTTDPASGTTGSQDDSSDGNNPDQPPASDNETPTTPPATNPTPPADPGTPPTSPTTPPAGPGSGGLGPG